MTTDKMFAVCILRFTGAMTIITPGSSTQLVIALLVVQTNMLFVLKLGPFVDAADDYLSFLTSGQMCLTLLGGLLLMTDSPDNPTYDITFMGTLLIVINGAGFVALIFSLLSLNPKVRACLNKRGSANNKEQGSTTKVTPALDLNDVNYPVGVDKDDGSDKRSSNAGEDQALRSWGEE